MEFFDAAYRYFAPLLLLLSLFLKKPNKFYCLNVLAIVNMLLIFNSIFIIRQLYAFAQLAMQMGVKPNPNLKIQIGWQDVKMWLTILLPFLFLIKPISANKWLTLLMLFLLFNNDIIYIYNCIKGNTTFYFNDFTTYHLSFKIMHYICWIIVLYVALKFVKYLPYNKKIAQFNSQ